MKKFNFKLEPYLKLKMMQEKEKLFAFSQVAGKMNKNQREVELYQLEANRLLNKENMASLSINDIRLVDHYLYGLKLRKQAAERRNESLQGEMDKKKRDLTEARKKRRVVEWLKENRLQEYRQEQIKADLQETDDYSQRRMFKK